jgi:hypothetical protein
VSAGHTIMDYLKNPNAQSSPIVIPAESSNAPTQPSRLEKQIGSLTGLYELKLTSATAVTSKLPALQSLLFSE